VKRVLTNFLLALLLVCGLNYTAHPDKISFRDLVLSSPGSPPLSPAALVPSADGKELFIACETANEVIAYNVAEREITRRIELPGSPSGLTLTSDGQTLYVTCSAPKSWIYAIRTSTAKIRTRLPSGHTTMAPLVSPDGRFLYVCERFNDSVQVLDLKSGKEIARIQVDREPVAAALSPDGKLLFVANHIHTGRSDVGVVAATVTVIDTAALKVVKNIRLTNGSTLLRGICVSPDGKYVALTHILARFHLPTTTVEHGWMNDNALSLIDVTTLDLMTTVLLDEDRRGAANPWAVRWSDDGKQICVTHAGTHELSLIDAPGLIAKVTSLPVRLDEPAKPTKYAEQAQVISDIPNDLNFLSGLRTRIKLHGKSPRCVVFTGGKIFAANYFSDSLSVVYLNCSTHSSATIQLQLPIEIAPGRKGEMYFNDATLCYQGWQSCASCHSSDARVDGMNWDLLNDGMGNPKNVKSLLLSFQTPPVMSLGVRSDAAAAIRAGMRHILFTEPRPEVASALDQYVKNLQPIPSPFLVHNRPSAAAQRGRKLFFSQSVGCSSCHSPPLFTDLKPHAIGTGKFDQATDQFYTPTLIELWRTAPYMHDGSAATLQDVLAIHGTKSQHLSQSETEDLAAFLLTL